MEGYYGATRRIETTCIRNRRAFVVVFIAFGIITWFKPETFIPWAGELAMCLIPTAQIIMGMVWQSNYPPPAASLAQP